MPSLLRRLVSQFLARFVAVTEARQGVPPPASSSVSLPLELASAKRTRRDVDTVLRNLSVERLREVCRTLPIGALDFTDPGRNEEMTKMVSCTFFAASYVDQKARACEIAR
jgi:hypothetical protein